MFCRRPLGAPYGVLLSTDRKPGGKWSRWKPADFASDSDERDAALDARGRLALFASDRGRCAPGIACREYDLWQATRGSNGEWSRALPLPPPINDPGASQRSPSLTRRGVLYFLSNRPGGAGGWDIWVARPSASGFAEPEPLPRPINTPGDETGVAVSPDGKLVVFSVDSEQGGSDLYVVAEHKGAWQQPACLPFPITTPADEFAPSFSGDGRWLYFSTRRGHAGPLEPRLDDPPDDANVLGLGNGDNRDFYRVPASDVRRLSRTGQGCSFAAAGEPR